MPLNLRPVGAALDSARRQMGSFLAWWLSELRAAWEDFSLWRTERHGGRGEIVIGGNQATLARVVRAERHPLAQSDTPAQPSDWPALIRSLLEQHAASLRRLDLVLPPEAVLVRRLRLPAAAGNRLHQTLGYQLERLLPLRAERLYFDCAVEARGLAHKRISVALAAVRREPVEALAATALECGIRCVVVSAAATSGRRWVFLRRNALPAAESGGGFDRWLATSAAALWLLAMAVILGQYHTENQRLAAQVRTLQVRAAAADGLRRSLEVRLRQIRFLADRSQDPNASASTLIAELTRRLPPSAWVFQLQDEDGAVRISGFAVNASAITAQLARSKLFTGVVLRSAVKAPAGDRERFDISFHLKAPAAS